MSRPGCQGMSRQPNDWRSTIGRGSVYAAHDMPAGKTRRCKKMGTLGVDGLTVAQRSGLPDISTGSVQSGCRACHTWYLLSATGYMFTIGFGILPTCAHAATVQLPPVPARKSEPQPPPASL